MAPHKDTQEKKCPQCGRTFTRKSSMDRHMRTTHKKVSIFNCGQCNKTFARSDLLNRHLKMHRGEGFKECDYCGRSCRSDYIDKHTAKCQQRYARKNDDDIDSPGTMLTKGHTNSRNLTWEPTLKPKASVPLSSKGLTNSAKRIRFTQYTPVDTDDLLRSAVKALYERNSQVLQRLEKRLPRNCGNRLLVMFKEEHGSDGWRTSVVHGHLETIGFPIRLGADVNANFYDGLTALHIAVIHGRFHTVEFFIGSGADINAVNNDGRTALHFAIKDESTPIMNLLIRSGADVNALDEFGRTALHVAAIHDHFDAAKILLSCGATLNIKDTGTWTPLTTIGRISTGRHRIAELILDTTDLEGLDVERRQEWLGIAVRLRRHSCVQRLIKAGDLDVNVRTPKPFQYPYIHTAVVNGDLDMVEILLAAGANAESYARNIPPALYLAARDGHVPILRYLVQEKADVNFGFPCPLEGAILGPDEEALRILLDAGALWEKLTHGMYFQFARVKVDAGLARRFPRVEEKIRIVEKFGLSTTNTYGSWGRED